MDFLKDFELIPLLLVSLLFVIYPKVIRNQLTASSSEELSKTYSFKDFLKEKIFDKVLPLPNWSLIFFFTAIFLLPELVSQKSTILSLTSTVVSGVVFTYILYILKKRELHKKNGIQSANRGLAYQIIYFPIAIILLISGIVAFGSWNSYLSNRTIENWRKHCATQPVYINNYANCDADWKAVTSLAKSWAIYSSGLVLFLLIILFILNKYGKSSSLQKP